MSIELDGIYTKRYKIVDDESIDIIVDPLNKAKLHTLRLHKSTESQNGDVVITKILAKSVSPIVAKYDLHIEFIGNSITCGMGNDLSIPCNSNKWYDQHNAYYSYASLTAKALNAKFLISAVSGSGIYRNWNSAGPTIPQVYDNLDMSYGDKIKRDFKIFKPDLITICMGTNDMSSGDGQTTRLDFDRLEFILKYVDFIREVKSKYPEANLLLLSSPMVGGQRGNILKKCILNIKDIVNETSSVGVDYFEFSAMTPMGCGSHPLIDEHKIMSHQLADFIEARYM